PRHAERERKIMRLAVSLMTMGRQVRSNFGLTIPSVVRFFVRMVSTASFRIWSTLNSVGISLILSASRRSVADLMYYSAALRKQSLRLFSSSNQRCCNGVEHLDG
ncbi:hypothetical protein PENTCL1PPCAC_23707, partial [Pristionchus entomophagus]